MVHEEYEEDEEDEDEGEVVGVAAIATTSTPSTPLFDAPNENIIINHKCLMAKATEVTSSSKLFSNISLMNDAKSLEVKCELVSLDVFMSNLQGDAKEHFEALLSQLGEAKDLLDEQD